MPTEDDVWQDLRKVLPRGHWVRVENPICDPGTPDVSFCIQLVTRDVLEGWIELKYTETLPLEHPVLPTQKIWIRKRLSQGGKVLIAVAIKRTLYLVSGDEAPTINRWLLQDFVDNAIAIAENRGDRFCVQRAFSQAFDWLLR